MEKLVYRAIKSNSSNTIIGIGLDENQANVDYNQGEGTWCDFTFTEFPIITFDDKTQLVIDEFNNWIQCNTPYENYESIYNFINNIFRVFNNKIVVKTESQIKALIEEVKLEIAKCGYTSFYIDLHPIIDEDVIIEEEKKEYIPITFEDAIREAIE